MIFSYSRVTFLVVTASMCCPTVLLYAFTTLRESHILLSLTLSYVINLACKPSGVFFFKYIWAYGFYFLSVSNLSLSHTFLAPFTYSDRLGV